MDSTGVLQMLFDADEWHSMMSFAPGIPVALGGTLELCFAASVNINSQAGRTIHIFDWIGVAPSGTFNVMSPYAWDLSQLYSTGEITLGAAPGLLGDFNGDNHLDAADYVWWRKNNSGDSAAYTIWRQNFDNFAPSAGSSAEGASSIPEPASAALLVFGRAAMCWRRLET